MEYYSLPINPISIKGNWDSGWVLDKHIFEYKSRNSFGQKDCDTVRSELGKAIYSFKYGISESRFLQIEPIAHTFADFISNREELNEVDAILYAPATNTERKHNPIEIIAKKVGALLELPVPENYLLKIKETIEMKDLYDLEMKRINLKGAFKVADLRFKKKQLLLLDDIIDSGVTLNSIVSELRSKGEIEKVFVLAGTYTDCFINTL